MGQQDTSTKHPADIPKLTQWPGQTIKPHEARAWGQSLDNVMVHYAGLTSVARNRMPPGKFQKLWSYEALAPPPPLPENASFRDMMSHRSAVDRVEERENSNAMIMEQRQEWWQQNNHLLFTT